MNTGTWRNLATRHGTRDDVPAAPAAALAALAARTAETGTQ
ncbi:MAG: hypothetical protein ACODAE_07895 [Gemmatimonadota bacterium]